MRRAVDTANICPASVRTDDDKSVVRDGADWTVRQWNRADASPICSNPTQETKALLSFLRGFGAGQMLGSQVSYATPTDGPAMVNTISGDYPSLYGFAMSDIKGDDKFDLQGSNKATVKADIEAAFSAGKVICCEDHMYNFLTGGNFYDRSNACMREIAPSGSKHAEFVAYLDKLVVWFDSLSSGGKKVPVVLRLFHEAKLASFWWSNYETLDANNEPWVRTSDYITAFRFAVNYLKSRLTNVLFVYCQGAANGGVIPVNGMPKSWYQETFPGADVCDIIGIDCYANGGHPFPGQFNHGWLIAAYDACAELSVTHDKPFVLPEFGFGYSAQRWGENGEAGGFWTEVFLPQLRARPVQPKYMMLWTGQWAPSTAKLTTADAALFFQHKYIQTASDISRLEIYGF